MEDTKYFECFNTKLTEFISDLTTSFPNVKDLKPLKSGLSLAVTMDLKLPQRVFSQHLNETLENMILNKEETFLLESDYKQIVDTHGIDVDIINTIKNIWKTLGDSDKEAIWKYLQVLVLLNKKCKGTL
jgi:hypothetical protein